MSPSHITYICMLNMKLTKKSIRTVNDCIEHYSVFIYGNVNLRIQNTIWRTVTHITGNYIWSFVLKNIKSKYKY